MKSPHLARVRTIYKKEIVDTLRDRRTLATMLLVPMVLYPAGLILASETILVHQKHGDVRDIRVGIDGALPEPTLTALGATAGLELRHLEPGIAAAATSTEALDAAMRDVLASGRADVVIVARDGTKEALEGSGTADVLLLFDETQAHAETAADRVEDALSAHAVEVRDLRMARLGVPSTVARPLSIDRRSVATEGDLGNKLASTSLPGLVLLFIAISCFYPAVDLTTGEKERKTLSTLLTAPVHAFDIVAGKYLAVVTVGTIAGLLNVFALGATLFRVFGTSHEAAMPVLAFTPATIAALLLCVLLIALPVSALMLLVATLARSFRDASNLMAPVLLLSTLPAVLASLPGFELTPGLAALPLANVPLLMKALILGRAEPFQLVLVVASTSAATVVLLVATARVFQDERVLFSTEGRRADLRAVLLAPPPVAISTVLALASVMFVANYYGSFFGDRGAAKILFVQLVSHLIPALGFALWMRPSISSRALLLLERPGARAIAAGILVGAGGWLGLSLPAGWLASFVLPGQAQAAEAFRDLLGLDQIGFPLMLFSLAIVPAFAEELAYRGAIFGILLRTSRPWVAVVVQALVFGVMHGLGIRLLPTALLGAALGALALRTRSIVPGMIAHAMTNAILLSIDRAGPDGLKETIMSPTPLALLGLGAVAAGLVIARAPPNPGPSAREPMAPPNV